MTLKERQEVEAICKEFAEPFKNTVGEINGSGWLIVDPLSDYLNHIGWENKCEQIPATDKHPQVLVLTFKDGTKLIPAGADLKPLKDGFTNWMWL